MLSMTIGINRLKGSRLFWRTSGEDFSKLQDRFDNLQGWDILVTQSLAAHERWASKKW
jgi:hypothetical protein